MQRCNIAKRQLLCPFVLTFQEGGRNVEINRKILKVGIFLIGALVVLGYVGVYLLTLEEPVFIEHYIEEQLYTGDQQGPRQAYVELYYITNVNDKRVVSKVDFPEYPDIQIPVSEYGMHGGFTMFSDGQQQLPGTIEGRYNMRTVYLEFAFGEDYQDAESIEITEAIVHLSDGSVFETEIGSINFHFDEPRSEMLESRGSSGSSYRTDMEFIARADVELIGLESPFLTLIDENLEMTINGRDYHEMNGMEIEEGKRVFIQTKIGNADGIEEDFRYLKLRPKLRFISEDSKEETVSLIVGWYRSPEYDFIEILQYLQQKGAL